MAEIVTALQQLGFSDYEGRAYTALLQQSPLTGYELAKISGVPRANIYAVLQKLEEHGAVVRLDTPEGVRYTPIAPADLTRQLERRFADTLDAARQAFAALPPPPAPEHVWNVAGQAALLDRARSLLAAAQTQLLVACGPREARALAPDLAAAQAKGVAITTLCLAGCPRECGHCQGMVARTALAPDEHWLILVADDRELLAGEIGEPGSATAVGTRQRLLVALAGWAIRHTLTADALAGSPSQPDLLTTDDLNQPNLLP
jgi:predicted transcriptional regulator